MMSFKSPNSTELAAVERLKKRFAASEPPVHHTFTDTAVLRFYRGRKAIEDDAYKAMMRHLQWRKDHQVDNINNDVHMFQKEIDAKKIVAEGYDLDGRPCVFVHTKNHNKNDRDLVQLKMLIIYTIENILLRTNPDEERILICFDLTGFKLMNMDYDMVKLLITTMDFNYPETLNLSLVINAPYLFYACYAVISPWLDPVTAAKVKFVSSEKLHDYVTFNAPNGMEQEYTSGKAMYSQRTEPDHTCSDSPNKTPDKNRTHSKKTIQELSLEFDAMFNQNHNTANNSCANTVSSTASTSSPVKSPVAKKSTNSWW